MGAVTSRGVDMTRAKVSRTNKTLHDAVLEFFWSPHIILYLVSYLVFGAALLTGIASVWSNDNWNNNQMTYTTYFSTTNPSNNLLELQVNTGIGHAFYTKWYWGGFSIGTFAIWLFATVTMIAWSTFGYTSLLEKYPDMKQGHIGRFIEMYFVRQLNHRHVDPLYHITTCFVFVALYQFLFWSVYTPRDIVTLVIYGMFVIAIRGVYLVAELDNQSLLFNVENGELLTTKGKPVQEYRRGRSGIYIMLAFMHIVNFVWLGWYFWKLPSAGRADFLYGDYFVIVFVDVLLYIMSVLYFYSQSYVLLRKVLMLFLNVSLAPFRICFGDKGDISDIAVKSSVSYIFIAAIFLIEYWTAWSLVTNYSFWPPFDWAV